MWEENPRSAPLTSPTRQPKAITSILSSRKHIYANLLSTPPSCESWSKAPTLQRVNSNFLQAKCMLVNLSKKKKTSATKSRRTANTKKPYGEDAPPRPVEGDAVHRRQVSQDPLVHLHVLVHGGGHQLPQAVGAVQPSAVARLHWTQTRR